MEVLADLLPQVVRLVESAAVLILEEYARYEHGGDVTLKSDRSPLTNADLASHRLLTAGLGALVPRYPVLSEEGADVPFAERERWPRFWLVDPLDGTREFLDRNGEFTINVALIERDTPLLGVVNAPALGETYEAARGVGARARSAQAPEPRPIHVADYRSAEHLRIVVSRSYSDPATEAFVASFPGAERRSIGSALKLCKIADGSAHLYPRFGPTMEWDIAAADCIVREAGGTVTDLAGEPLRYNKRDLHNPFFVAAGNPSPPWQTHLPHGR